MTVPAAASVCLAAICCCKAPAARLTDLGRPLFQVLCWQHTSRADHVNTAAGQLGSSSVTRPMLVISIHSIMGWQ